MKIHVIAERIFRKTSYSCGLDHNYRHVTNR